MAVPDSRNTTYVTGVSQVKADDLNDLQDCVIHGAVGPQFKTVSRWLPYNFGTSPSGLNLISGSFDGSAGSPSLTCDPDLDEGDRVDSLAVYVKGDGSNDHNLSAWIVSHNPAVAPVQLGTTLVSTNTPNAWTLLTLPFTPAVLAAGTGLVVLLEGAIAGSFVGALRAGWRRPLP